MALTDVRNIRSLDLELGPGLNVFTGENAQGKTTLLEAVGLIARGRSFRSDGTRGMIRRGCEALRAQGALREAERETALAVEIHGSVRVLRVDAREVTAREYLGRLEVAVYSSERLAAVRGTQRERRLFLDRNAAALWPAYRALLRGYERVVEQRNAALERRGRDLEAWSERLLDLGAELRARRAQYARRLHAALGRGFRPGNEEYQVRAEPEGELGAQTLGLRAELLAQRAAEFRARRSLAGPHRDRVVMTVNGVDAAAGVSAGQARSLLLALTLATLQLYREEHDRAAVALLDDLDSELDERRARELCEQVARRGQTLVTSAHEGWARGLSDLGRAFRVAGGAVSGCGAA